MSSYLNFVRVDRARIRASLEEKTVEELRSLLSQSKNKKGGGLVALASRRRKRAVISLLIAEKQKTI